MAPRSFACLHVRRRAVHRRGAFASSDSPCGAAGVRQPRGLPRSDRSRPGTSVMHRPHPRTRRAELLVPGGQLVGEPLAVARVTWTAARCRRGCTRSSGREARVPVAHPVRRRRRRRSASSSHGRRRSRSGRRTCSCRRPGSALRASAQCAWSYRSASRVAQVGGVEVPSHVRGHVGDRPLGRRHFLVGRRRPVGTIISTSAPRCVPDLGEEPVPLRVHHLRQREIEARPGARPRVHRGAEAGAAGARALHDDDERRLAARPVDRHPNRAGRAAPRPATWIPSSSQGRTPRSAIGGGGGSPSVKRTPFAPRSARHSRTIGGWSRRFQECAPCVTRTGEGCRSG